MIFPSSIKKFAKYLLRYPQVGRVLSTLFGVLEVPILDSIFWLDRNTRYRYYEDLMKKMTTIYGSRIIPLNTSLEAVKTIAPTEEILSILSRVEEVSIGYCYCRARHQNCDNELWTCIHIGSAKSIDELAKKVPIRSSTHEEVEQIIRRSHEAGLVHQLITAPISDYFYVICNCCPCCCVMLNSSIRYGARNTAVSSNFIIKKDELLCTECGSCVDRCHFGAHTQMGEKYLFDRINCVGCGLCVTSCPSGALTLRRKDEL